MKKRLTETQKVMAEGIAKMAVELDNLHQATHLIAAAAAVTNNKKVFDGMMELCDHFHALNDKLKAVFDGLTGYEEPKRDASVDMMSEAEFLRALNAKPKGEAH